MRRAGPGCSSTPQAVATFGRVPSVVAPRLLGVATTFGWDEFELDPRLAEHAQLRASDADRDVVHRALGSAYGDGRLDRDEFDQRSAAVLRARTLGQLPPLLSDLVPVDEPLGRVQVRPAAESSRQQEAEARYRAKRREAVWGFVSASLICWVIWGLTMYGGFPWPVFVMLGTGLNAGRMVFMRQEQIAAERRHLERRDRRSLEWGEPRDGDG